MDRREFLKAAAAIPVTHRAAREAQAPAAVAPGPAAAAQGFSPASADRDAWIATMRRLADPVLTNLANGTLKARIPLEQAAGAGADRRAVTHEAPGRLLAGLAP